MGIFDNLFGGDDDDTSDTNTDTDIFDIFGSTETSDSSSDDDFLDFVDSDDGPSDDWKDGHSDGFRSNSVGDGVAAAGSAFLRGIYGEENEQINEYDAGREQGVKDRYKYR